MKSNRSRKQPQIQRVCYVIFYDTTGGHFRLLATSSQWRFDDGLVQNNGTVLFTYWKFVPFALTLSWHKSSWHGNTSTLPPPVTRIHGLQRISDKELWTFVCWWHGQVVKQEVKLSVISDAHVISLSGYLYISFTIRGNSLEPM